MSTKARQQSPNPRPAADPKLSLFAVFHLNLAFSSFE
jgi:hypothetical protein